MKKVIKQIKFYQKKWERELETNDMNFKNNIDCITDTINDIYTLDRAIENIRDNVNHYRETQNCIKQDIVIFKKLLKELDKKAE